MTTKITSERSQKLVQELVLQPGNDICADCKTRSPRWASHNLGIFLCVHCASIHRKIGTHITKVKSVTMDLWTKEQAENMKNIGNIKSNAIYNPNEIRNPPPPPLMDATRDNELEQYIRSKYEFKRFFDKSALVASKLGPSRSTQSISSRPRTAPLEKAAPPMPARPLTASISNQARSTSQPVPQAAPSAQSRVVSQPPMQQQQIQPQPPTGVWADLVQLQAPPSGSSLPLQYQQNTSFPMMNQQQPQMIMNPTGMNMGFQVQPPYNPFMQQQQAQQPQFQPQQQYYANQIQSPVAQPASYMFSPQPQQQQMQYGGQMMSTTPQLMSTTPNFMSTTPQMMTSPMQMHMTPSPSINFMPQQHQQQQPLPPMGGGAWPQPMYQQQQQQQQQMMMMPMMQQGQWSAM